MSKHRLVISPAARDDLRHIFQFGLLTWGEHQSTIYLDKLKELFWLLTQQPHIGIERCEIFLETRSIAVESHVVFYQVRSSHIEIVRVLHARQDPNRHIT